MARPTPLDPKKILSPYFDKNEITSTTMMNSVHLLNVVNEHDGWGDWLAHVVADFTENMRVSFCYSSRQVGPYILGYVDSQPNFMERMTVEISIKENYLSAYMDTRIGSLVIDGERKFNRRVSVIHHMLIAGDVERLFTNLVYQLGENFIKSEWFKTFSKYANGEADGPFDHYKYYSEWCDTLRS